MQPVCYRLTLMGSMTDPDRVDAILHGLRPRHRRVLILGARGVPGVEIARSVGLRAPETVYRIHRRYRDRLSELVRWFEAAEIGLTSQVDDWGDQDWQD